MENSSVTPVVIVIGAVNMDICGRPRLGVNMHDSNPGSITTTPGGVGRNIAHNLCLLGLDVKLLSAMGDDVYGQSVYASCLELGMDMSLCRRIKGGRTSCYMYVTDEKGDMLVGVSDTDIAGSITPEYLKQHLGKINSAAAVVIDGNLSTETVRWIAENVTAPLFADPVSITKAERLRPVLGKLFAFKPNEIEAKSMTGESTALRSAEALMRLGVQRVFVSLGSDGIVAAEGDEIVKLPCSPIKLVNTTGCGDAATAAIVWASVTGLGLVETASAAMKAAALCAECESTVNPKLSPSIFNAF